MRHDERCWQQDDLDRLIVWQPASPPRAVEGPLALECFDGSSLVLELAPEQIACREDAGCLQQVFLGSVHRLEIGKGRELVSPSSRLIFLRSDVPLDLHWTDNAFLSLDLAGSDMADRSHDQDLRLPLRGVCRLRLAEPMLFYRSVLQGLKQPPQDRMLDVLDALVRTHLESHLKPLMYGGRLDQLRAQTHLADLGPADLVEDLAEFGLDCLHMAAYLPQDYEEPLMTVPVGSPLAGSYDDLL